MTCNDVTQESSTATNTPEPIATDTPVPTPTSTPTPTPSRSSEYSEAEVISLFRLYLDQLYEDASSEFLDFIREFRNSGCEPSVRALNPALPPCEDWIMLTNDALYEESFRALGRARGNMSAEYQGQRAWLITVKYTIWSEGPEESQTWWWFKRRSSLPRLHSEQIYPGSPIS